MRSDVELQVPDRIFDIRSPIEEDRLLTQDHVRIFRVDVDGNARHARLLLQGCHKFIRVQEVLHTPVNDDADHPLSGRMTMTDQQVAHQPRVRVLIIRRNLIAIHVR